MDGKLMDYLEVKKLEKMPTKKELIATIARLINQVRPPRGRLPPPHPAAPHPGHGQAAHLPWGCPVALRGPADCTPAATDRQRSTVQLQSPAAAPPLSTCSPPPPPQVPTKVARGINQVPTKLAYGVKALADGDDNKELKVGGCQGDQGSESAAQ